MNEVHLVATTAVAVAAARGDGAAAHLRGEDKERGWRGSRDAGQVGEEEKLRGSTRNSKGSGKLLLHRFSRHFFRPKADGG